MNDLLALYTAQVLAHRLGAGDGGYACAQAASASLAPLVRAGRRTGKLLLLGLGAGQALASLERELPPEVEIAVLELSPDQARRVGGWSGRARLLVDASPLALLGLAVLGGLWPGAALAQNPEAADPGARKRLRDLGRLLAAYQPVDLTLPAGAEIFAGERAPGENGDGERAVGALGTGEPGRGQTGARPVDVSGVSILNAGSAPNARADAGEHSKAVKDRISAPTRPANIGPNSDPDRGLCLGAILHPDEPDLQGFFDALPACCDRAVVVWDSVRPPNDAPRARCPVLHLAHPLEADFAAQRNRMLAACRGEWVLTLDGDERVPPALAALLPALMARPDWNAVALARHGLRPGDTFGLGVRVGYGLWPDVQLRLFRNLPGLRYVRPVHERLEGLTGATGLVLAPALSHLGDLVKDRAALARKHALYDKAGAGAVRHRQNAAFPELSERVFQAHTPGVTVGKFAAGVNLAGLSS